MSQGAVVNPEELERFARELQRFNATLTEESNRLATHFAHLGETWRDQEQQKFAQEFTQTMRVLRSFTASAEQQVPLLLRKARIIKEQYFGGSF